VQDALIEDYFRYDDLSRMVADDILMNISEIESPNYEYADLDLLNLPRDGIGPIRKISALDWFLSFWPNENFYIVLTDLTILRLINQG
jgi:hypothetical protein